MLKRLINLDKSLINKYLRGPYHFELGLGLLHQVILFRLSDAGEDPHLGIEVQHVAMEIC